MEQEDDGRLSFDQAAHYVQQQPGKAAFAAMPVFGERSDDAEQRAEGARVFILEGDGAGSYRLRFVAGPFFSNVRGAEEVMAAAEIPDPAKSLRFLPTRFEADWLDGQIQVLIQKLMQATGQQAPQMPDYSSVAARAADPAVIPVSFIGRGSRGEE